MGLEIPKGYGPNYLACGPLHTEVERCSGIRVGSGMESRMGGPVYLEENGTLKEKVREPVQWLGRKYTSKRFESSTTQELCIQESYAQWDGIRCEVLEPQ